MDELGKVKRVIEKQAPVTEVLLVLDATTGQNGLIQARVFSEIVDVTGIVLTKLDGSAKGGIVVQVQRELGVPVKLVGLGEGADDMAPFDAAAFVDAPPRLTRPPFQRSPAGRGSLNMSGLARADKFSESLTSRRRDPVQIVRSGRGGPGPRRR